MQDARAIHHEERERGERGGGLPCRFLWEGGGAAECASPLEDACTAPSEPLRMHACAFLWEAAAPSARVPVPAPTSTHHNLDLLEKRQTQCGLNVFRSAHVTCIVYC
jgi:hypothetical protein